jgi:antitoxin ParD1/3/4
MTVAMTVSLPELLREHVQQRVAEGGFANASDFVRTLIGEDLERQAKAKLEAMLMEGARSGEAEEADGPYWEQAHNYDAMPIQRDVARIFVQRRKAALRFIEIPVAPIKRIAAAMGDRTNGDFAIIRPIDQIVRKSLEVGNGGRRFSFGARLQETRI